MLARAVLGALVLHAAVARAQEGTPAALLELTYAPTARAQVALWVEDASGEFLATVRLTEAVAFRGIGNRPGASEMNSGYRWPYGRREGVLPVWASRRASAPGASRFPRVVFQNRIEGKASRLVNDQSVDNYYCLSFDASKSSRDALDAVSCASVFTSDKGRYLTANDLAANYGEPYEAIGTRAASRVPLSVTSLYPPRMDVVRCTTGACYDHQDLSDFADAARRVMPDIDVVTMATPPGDVRQTVLFSVPETWPAGNYVAFLEINVEGDHDGTWSEAAHPTPTSPTGDWDSWAMNFGYPYRGQPSIVFTVPFTLGAPGEQVFAADAPVGRSSWDVWSEGFGELLPPTDITDDPSSAPGSGADRLRRDADGHRFVVRAKVLDELPPPPDPEDPGTSKPPLGEGNAGTFGGAAGAAGDGAAASGGGAGSGAGDEPGTQAGGVTKPGDDGKGVIIEDTGGGLEGPVGAIYDLELRHHDDRLRAHTWIHLRLRAAESVMPLHAYEVRVATEPIVDEATFIRNGRQARDATDDPEGATLLMLPTDAAAGEVIETDVGDLVAETRYYVGVRAVDVLNRPGPISVAEITTKRRIFATVTPCFVATVAYGSPLAAEVSVLRELRDRYLLTNAPGRALVSLYYVVGPRLARVVAEHDWLRSGVRTVLSSIVALSTLLLED